VEVFDFVRKALQEENLRKELEEAEGINHAEENDKIMEEVAPAPVPSVGRKAIPLREQLKKDFQVVERDLDEELDELKKFINEHVSCVLSLQPNSLYAPMLNVQRSSFLETNVH